MSIVEEVRHCSGPGVMHPHGVIHELHPIGFTRLHDIIELSHVKRHRLLQKQVLLLPGGEHGPPVVEGGGERHVHGVHVGVVEEGLVGAVHVSRKRERIGGGECGGFVEGAARHRAEGGVWGEVDGTGDFPSYVSAADHSYLDQCFGHLGQSELS